MSGTDDDAGVDGGTSGHGFDVARRVTEIREADLYRDLQPADAVDSAAYFAPDPGGDLPVLSGERELVFASNNYLGLTQDERVQRAVAEAAETVGTGAGASRLVTGDTLLHRDLEARLAETKRTERALAFSSGYAANVGTIAALDPDVVFSDALNHASIVDACRLSNAEVVVYGHCDADDLRAKMAACDRPGSWLVVTDTVFSMDGTVAPLAELCNAADRHDAWVMVDEAHATGLYDDGGGIVQREGLSDRVDVQLGTLSKALASQGGYVAGSDALVELLVNDARSFVFSTGLTPTAAAAAGEALHIARHGAVRSRLWENVTHLREGLTDVGYDVHGDTQILPVMVGDREEALALADAVRDRGVLAPAIRPPTVPEGTSRIRVVPMATHDRVDIEDCILAFKEAGEDVGVL
ncbi:8-amino-7-oxononanoate synthase [Halorubellus sp. JP-L1]|uniref:aminotransferase class I/II-fold pyridoxal phosphate-dependent enzyme n=1 Tax=Halorubellus sp. JP-L1 TaxID=2715753 RepID=UPI00140BE750|nr:8-amino-7-oxononanoate synthase [Halorubellus sp. JP-L1]NHN41186.1 8-amino-7-oxononanoate synthase [Halorubellus sp. JP-L1]